MKRHYHCWVYERDTDGTINTLRRRPETYEKRRQAIYALQTFRFLPGVRGHVIQPGQVLACDDGAFCEPHLQVLSGYTVQGPVTQPITRLIDRQTGSQRPSRKEVLAWEVIEADPTINVVPEDPRKCRGCGHIRIAKDSDGREIAGGAHVNNSGLCWFCWLETPEGAEHKAEAEQEA